MASLSIKPAATSDDLFLKDGDGNTVLSVNGGGVNIKNQAGNVATFGYLVQGMDLNDTPLKRAKVEDYSETCYDIGTRTAAFDISMENGNVQKFTNNFSAGGLVGITNALSGAATSLTLIITNGGAQPLTFRSGSHSGSGNYVRWAGGTPPTLTTSGIDIITLMTYDGGTYWNGFVGGLAFA